MPPAFFLRQALGTGIGLLVLFVLAFGAITVLGRQRWAALGLRESLLARLAASLVLASIGLTGASSIVSLAYTEIGGGFILGFDGRAVLDARAIDTARMQAAAGLVLALAAAAGIVTWIETYHRRAIGAIPKEEGDEWIQEPAAPGAPVRPAGATAPPGPVH